MALPFLLFHAAAGEAVCGCLSFRLQQQHIIYLLSLHLLLYRLRP
jgi:hypothetical protein